MQRIAPVTNMLDVVAKFQDLRKKSQSLSKTKTLVAYFKNLRLAYDNLDTDTKTRLDNFLILNHQNLLELLQKSGSQLPKIAILSGLIDDNILAELTRLLQAAPAYKTESEDSYTTLFRKMSDEQIPDTGTVKITASASCHQLQEVLNSPNLKKVSRSYVAQTQFGSLRDAHPDDSLTIIINSFEILKRNDEIKQKFKDKADHQYVEAYASTIRREISVLRTPLHMNTLEKLANELTAYSDLKQIHSLLQIKDGDENEQLLTGEVITILLDNELIAALQKHKMNINDTRMGHREAM